MICPMRHWRRVVMHALLCLAALLDAGAYAAGKTDRPVFNVRDYGAVADGRTKDTHAIKDAIEACGRAGGGWSISRPDPT